MRKSEFEKEYFTNLIASYVKWEADENDIQVFLDDIEWMKFDVKFSNDCSIILDAGKYPIYIEWGPNECPVYVDIDGEYTYIGRVRNTRFWAIVERHRRN